MGIIPQSKNVNDTSSMSYFRINLFPNMLATVCDKLCAKYIHITTDCVFFLVTEEYTSETDKHDETNNYGISKSLGELGINATVIRTSIIGEELKK